MTNFTVTRVDNKFLITYGSSGESYTLAGIGINEKGSDRVKVYGALDLAKSNKPKAGPTNMRGEFVSKFRTSPTRLLILMMLQRFGSEERGLTVSLGLLLPIGKKFVDSLIKSGLAKKRSFWRGLFFSPETIRRANAVGKIELEKTLQHEALDNSRLEELLTLPEPKPKKKSWSLRPRMPACLRRKKPRPK